MGDVPETRPVPALPQHPDSPVLPDFHMATKALPQWVPSHRRGARVPFSPPKNSHTHKGLALRLLRKAPSPGAGDAGMMLQKTSGGTFCSKLEVLRDAQEKCNVGIGE